MAAAAIHYQDKGTQAGLAGKMRTDRKRTQDAGGTVLKNTCMMQKNMLECNSCEKKSDGPLALSVLRTSNIKEVTQ